MGADEPASTQLAPSVAESESTRLPAAFRSFRHRNYSLFWTGNFLSNIGTWMQNIALGWLILEITNSPFLLGLNGFLSQVPVLIFALPGGAIADRLDRRKLMLSTQTAMMLLALVLAVLTSFRHVTIYEILLISLLTGTAGALNYPAYQALIPDLVERDDLLNAIALNSAQFNIARAVGPTLAGLTLGTLGVAACFYLNSVSFLALIVALLMIAIPPLVTRGDAALWDAMLGAFRFFNEYRLLIVILTIPAFMSLFALPFIVLMPDVARDLLKVGASGLGFLMAGAGLGAVIAALVIAAWGTPRRRGEFILSSACVFSLALILFARARTFWPAFALLVVMGAMMVGTLTLTNTTLQMSAPDHLRGRVMSLYYMAMTGLAPLGSLQAGVVAEYLGTRFALAFGGVVCLIYFLILLALLPQIRKVAHLPRPEGPPG